MKRWIAQNKNIVIAHVVGFMTCATCIAVYYILMPKCLNAADLNCDQKVDVMDFSIFMANSPEKY